MNIPTKHPKQEFQVERIAFFSDAVFAIAITLLVIEFRPPHLDAKTTSASLWAELHHMKFQFLALVFSFILVVKYWIRHHILFKNLHDYNQQIITANMLALLPVIFFPFSTAFLYESFGTSIDVLIIAARFFLLNNIFAGITMYYLHWSINVRNKDCAYEMPAAESRLFKRQLFQLTGLFLVLIICTLFI